MAGKVKAPLGLLVLLMVTSTFIARAEVIQAASVQPTLGSPGTTATGVGGQEGHEATSASSVMSVCTGAQLCLHWTACLNSPDVISQVLWFHQDTPPLLIAVATDGQIVSTAAFTGRVQQTTNAGITLHDLTTSDAGNYSVEVWVEKEDGSIDIWTASVYVLVTDCVNTQPSDASMPEAMRGAGRVVMGDCQDSVEDRLGDLQREVKELMEKNKDLTEKNNDLTERNNDLTEKNNDLTEKNNDLTEKNDDLTEKNNDMTQENEDLTEKNNDLTEKNNDLTEKNNDLTEKNNDLTEKNNDMTQENEDLTEKNNDLTEKNNNLTQENVNLTAKLSAVDEKQPTCQADCLKGGVIFHETCYIFFDVPEPWKEAKSICEAISGELLEVHSEDVSNFITSFLLNVTTSWKDSVWLGLNDKAKEGSFVWASSQLPPTFTAWNQGEPNNYKGREDCAAIRANNYLNWNDGMCTHPFWFVCQLRQA